MPLTLDLPPDLEARLAQQARARGLDLPRFAAKLLAQAASVPSPRTPRSQEAFDAFAAAFAQGSEALPALPTAAFTRESFYENRG